MGEHTIKENSMGILLIHGFGGNVSEVEPLREFLSASGFRVVSTMLSGHGGTRAQLRCSGWQDWVASAQRDLDTLRRNTERVFIVGFSMGGLIAIHLAIDNPVIGIATLNSPIYCWHKRQILRNTIQDLKYGESGHLRHYLESGTKFPWRTLLNFQRLLHLTKERLMELTCPIFIAQGTLDDTVSPRSADHILKNTASEKKQLQHYYKSSHLICHGPDNDALFRDLKGFIEEIL